MWKFCRQQGDLDVSAAGGIFMKKSIYLPWCCWIYYCDGVTLIHLSYYTVWLWVCADYVAWRLQGSCTAIRSPDSLLKCISKCGTGNLEVHAGAWIVSPIFLICFAIVVIVIVAVVLRNIVNHICVVTILMVVLRSVRCF